MSNSGDIENNELIKNDLIEQLDKYKRSRASYPGKVTQNISKINNSITLDNQIITMKECLYKVEKYLHKIKSVSQKMIELSTDENIIKTITLKVTEQEFHIIQMKKSIKITKRRIQIFLLRIVTSYLLPQSLNLVKKKPKMLKTILNPREILKVTQIIHRQALQTLFILICKNLNFHQIISKH